MPSRDDELPPFEGDPLEPDPEQHARSVATAVDEHDDDHGDWRDDHDDHDDHEILGHDEHELHDEHGHDEQDHGHDDRWPDEDEADARHLDHDGGDGGDDPVHPTPSRGEPSGPRRNRRHRFIAFTHRHKILCGVVIVLLPLFLYASVTWIKAVTKEGSESFVARNAEWARDMGAGFLVDRIEQAKFEQESNDVPIGGQPEGPIGPAAISPSTTDKQSTVTTKPLPPHLNPPLRMPTPAGQPLPNEGEWFPAGPDVGGGLHPMYYTKVRPNSETTSLLVFVGWIDPKLASIQLIPGTELPGGTWATPPRIPADQCSALIAGLNSGFRMDQARGGYYAEGREAFPLRNGAASMVFYKDGSVDIGQWGRDMGRDILNPDKTVAVRQNLELLVDNGQPVAGLENKDWGALLKNVYYVWRSGFGVTADGAIVYVGGPALQPANLAQRLIDAGAVRAMEMDINPEWVTANLYTQGADGQCHGVKGLDGPENQGGQRQPADRYLSTDTRDFVAIFSKPL